MSLVLFLTISALETGVLYLGFQSFISLVRSSSFNTISQSGHSWVIAVICFVLGLIHQISISLYEIIFSESLLNIERTSSPNHLILIGTK
jgi:hypothetical protein